jgi:hypothetical protein
LGHPERLLLGANIVDGRPQVAVPIDGIEGEIEVRVEHQHGETSG